VTKDGAIWGYSVRDRSSKAILLGATASQPADRSPELVVDVQEAVWLDPTKRKEWLKRFGQTASSHVDRVALQSRWDRPSTPCLHELLMTRLRLGLAVAAGALTLLGLGLGMSGSLLVIEF
jgi:hypothetical protein